MGCDGVMAFFRQHRGQYGHMNDLLPHGAHIVHDSAGWMYPSITSTRRYNPHASDSKLASLVSTSLFNRFVLLQSHSFISHVVFDGSRPAHKTHAGSTKRSVLFSPSPTASSLDYFPAT
jgi:hypothetical protein